MTTQSKSSIAALALVAALGLGASSAAQAGHDDVDVFWSIAMSQPGIRIGISNAPAPVVVHERYYLPPPRVVYVPAHPVYRVHPGYYGHGDGYRHGHGRGHDHWRDRDDRHFGRHDDRGRGEHHAQRGGDRGDRGDRGHSVGRGPEMHMGNRR